MSFHIADNIGLQNVLATMESSRQKIASTQKKGYFFIAGGIAVAIIGIAMGMVVAAIIAGLVPIVYGFIL